MHAQLASSELSYAHLDFQGLAGQCVQFSVKIAHPFERFCDFLLEFETVLADIVDLVLGVRPARGTLVSAAAWPL